MKSLMSTKDSVMSWTTSFKDFRKNEDSCLNPLFSLGLTLIVNSLGSSQHPSKWILTFFLAVAHHWEEDHVQKVL